MERVIRSGIGQLLRMRKTWSVRKFSILLRKRMRFTQVWTSLYARKANIRVSMLYNFLNMGLFRPLFDYFHPLHITI